MKVWFDHAEPLAPHITTFWFKPERPIDYIAGQYTQLHLPHNNVDNRGDKRWFTLSSSPSDELLSITTKFDPVKSSTFKQTLRQLKPGTKLNLADPMGDFVLPKDKARSLLFVVGGMGITPPHSMIKWLKDTGEQRQIHLVYAVTNLVDFVWLDLFASNDLQFTPIVTHPDANWKGASGDLTSQRILDFAAQADDPLIYLSGPEIMVETFVKDLSELGFDQSRLVTDYFPGYPLV